jgi:hypothetical protein
MNWSRWRSRNRLLVGAATSAAVVALIAVGVPAAALAAHSGSHARASSNSGGGYPPPGGIYKGFTNCPILNPLMQEGVSGSAVICTLGRVANGTVTLGNLTTAVTEPVNVQFGGVQLPNASLGGDWTTGIGSFAGGILPPPQGLSAMLKTKPDLIPESLTAALGCSTATDPVVLKLCAKANASTKNNQVFALAENVGQLTNFGLTTWTQRIAFKLINPLLGKNCSVGNANQPIVVNPNITLAPGGQLLVKPDPHPKKHPNTDVLDITAAVASDTTFTAPGVSGCGPGGASNIPVDEALDAGTGLPAASGVNSLTLNGSFEIADCFASANQANILLSAFNDSHFATPEHGRQVSRSQLQSVIRQLGMK